MSLIIRGSLIAKAHCSIMRAHGLIIGTMSRAHCAINHNEGNNEHGSLYNHSTMSSIVRLIVELIVFSSLRSELISNEIAI